MADDYTYTDETAQFSITNGTFYVRVTDDKRTTDNKKVSVTIEFELVATDSGPEFEYVTCNAPSNAITQREIEIISGVVDQLETDGLTVTGAPSLS